MEYGALIRIREVLLSLLLEEHTQIILARASRARKVQKASTNTEMLGSTK